ncbi:MAG: hypothetical protein KJ795_02555 [Gammaproteobacteria bacterium]|nr:hypothetical protein [Gammaproteobacteria bacterium]MBU1777223.1 hypothetical protein [Gammaproteobacteria bacterium]MBU1967649.1 hypothetical protein [Gammaproteobacteria bacterium]
MRQLIIVLFGLSIAMSATAAEWVEVSKSAYSSTYIDESSITKGQDGLVYYFAKIEYARALDKPFVYTSNVGRIIANCSQRTRAIHQSTYLNGRDVAYVSKVAGDFETPQGAGLALLNYACNKASATLQNNKSEALEKANILTALLIVGLAVIISIFSYRRLFRRYIDTPPETAHKQGVAWAVGMFSVAILYKLPGFIYNFDVDTFAVLLFNLIFFSAIGYAIGFAYFKIRNGDKGFDVVDDLPERKQVNEAAPKSIGITTEIINTTIEKNEEAIDLARYKQAAEEIETGNRDDALWYKAFAETNGVENATKAAYIRLRVDQLRCAAITALETSSVLTEAKPNVAQEARGANSQKQTARNLYEVLEIPRDASLITIETGCQMQMDLLDSFRYQSAEVEARRKLILHAKELLTDPVKRAVYDERIAISPPAKDFAAENFSFDLANDTMHEKIKREQLEIEKMDEAKEMVLKEKYCLGFPIYPEDVAFLKQRGATWYM